MPENCEIALIQTVPAISEAQIGVGVTQAVLRPLTRSFSSRRRGVQQPEPPLAADRRRQHHPPPELLTDGLRLLISLLQDQPSQPSPPTSA
ncbi:hypothetical protein CRG98_000526 [Punica granatum]|uniref:Uncharacterized protein n=1 Tax=Punica granatum TaxID=22663 RepID=A0A2I0LED9_PUNGR|nr:hypothetical protein CRG98_000526 [Punica granatum]